jgi:hypothetical protein
MRRAFRPLMSLTLALLGAQEHTAIAGEPGTWQNPIIDRYLADPCIVRHAGAYWLFATGETQEDGRAIPIHRSTDLVQWEFVRGAVERGGPTAWNHKHFGERGTDDGGIAVEKRTILSQMHVRPSRRPRQAHGPPSGS